MQEPYIGLKFGNGINDLNDEYYYLPIKISSKIQRWIIGILLNCEVFEHHMGEITGFDFLKKTK